MDLPLAARAAGLQALAVAVLFALLVAAPLPEDFFEDWGALTGPAAWIVCALATARLLRLPLRVAAPAAAAGGAAGAAVGLGIDNTAGLVVAVVTFWAAAAALHGR